MMKRELVSMRADEDVWVGTCERCKAKPAYFEVCWGRAETPIRPARVRVRRLLCVACSREVVVPTPGHVYTLVSSRDSFA